MDNSEQIAGLLNTLGSLTEMAGFLRDNLMQHGFTREEAVMLSGQFLCAMIPKSGQKEE
jgi:hypothetical protein